MLKTILSISTLLSLATAAPNALRPRQSHNVTTHNKAGLGWNNPADTDMDQFFSTGKIGWYYTWSSWPTDEGSDLDFAPLLWGPNSLTDWNHNVAGVLKPMFQSGAISAVLGMNEPQERGQSNMTPAQGKDFWIAHIEPLRTQYPGLRLGSPATSSAPSGKIWIHDWLALCGTNCTIDFIALHYYGTNATVMIDYITDFHDTFQKPIWVTEWACQDFSGQNNQCDEQHVVDYMNVTQTFMDSVDWVERYAWFGALTDNPINEDNSILNENGRITELGAYYIGADYANITSDGDSNSSNGASSGVHPSLLFFRQFGMIGMVMQMIMTMVIFATIC